jgi:hypothetical protein
MIFITWFARKICCLCPSVTHCRTKACVAANHVRGVANRFGEYRSCRFFKNRGRIHAHLNFGRAIRKSHYTREVKAPNANTAVAQIGTRDQTRNLASHLSAHFLGDRRVLRKRTPSPPPFSSINSIPVFSNVALIAKTASSETWRRSFSKSTIVERPNPEFCARID